MNSPLTVLMPVYNAEKYLIEAIDSILNQTHRDFEFLIIDDGSTDSSIDIITSFKDPRIRLIRNEENSGITKTLNKGIHLSSNELIARMDADDISHPDRLEKQYKYLQEHPDCALVSTWMRKISKDGKFLKISGVDTEHIYYSLLFISKGIYHPTVMYKKNAVTDVGLYSKEYSEDFNLWCKLVKKYKFHVIHEPLLDYRFSETSIWRITKKNEYEKAAIEQVLENVSYYTNNTCKLNDHEVKFFKGNVAPIVAFNNKKIIEDSFRKLDYITQSLQSFKNVNNTNNNIEKAASHFKFNLILKLSKYLNPAALLKLILKLKYWNIFFKYLNYKIRQKLKFK
jgi:glycosyltransferase involved in cell wall biosynthesis